MIIPLHNQMITICTGSKWSNQWNPHLLHMSYGTITFLVDLKNSPCLHWIHFLFQVHSIKTSLTWWTCCWILYVQASHQGGPLMTWRPMRMWSLLAIILWKCSFVDDLQQWSVQPPAGLVAYNAKLQGWLLMLFFWFLVRALPASLWLVQGGISFFLKRSRWNGNFASLTVVILDRNLIVSKWIGIITCLTVVLCRISIYLNSSMEWITAGIAVFLLHSISYNHLTWDIQCCSLHGQSMTQDISFNAT